MDTTAITQTAMQCVRLIMQRFAKNDERAMSGALVPVLLELTLKAEGQESKVAPPVEGLPNPLPPSPQIQAKSRAKEIGDAVETLVRQGAPAWVRVVFGTFLCEYEMHLQSCIPREINNLLKSYGAGVSNITNALSAAREYHYVAEVRDGSTVKYRLTNKGQDFANDIIQSKD